MSFPGWKVRSTQSMVRFSAQRWSWTIDDEDPQGWTTFILTIGPSLGQGSMFKLENLSMCSCEIEEPMRYSNRPFCSQGPWLAVRENILPIIKYLNISIPIFDVVCHCLSYQADVHSRSSDWGPICPLSVCQMLSIIDCGECCMIGSTKFSIARMKTMWHIATLLLAWVLCIWWGQQKYILLAPP